MKDVESLRYQARLMRDVVRLCIDGITHEQSVVQPRPAGNCVNWILGHLLVVYNQVLPLIGQEAVVTEGTLTRYARGSAPITRASEALLFHDVICAWDEVCARVDAGLATLTPHHLDAVVPEGPTGDPYETLGSLLATVLFHQAYHAGQLGVLRRIIGMPAALS